MSTIHKQLRAAGLEIRAEVRHRQVQHGQIHRIEETGKSEHGRAPSTPGSPRASMQQFVIPVISQVQGLAQEPPSLLYGDHVQRPFSPAGPDYFFEEPTRRRSPGRTESRIQSGEAETYDPGHLSPVQPEHLDAKGLEASLPALLLVDGEGWQVVGYGREIPEGPARRPARCPRATVQSRPGPDTTSARAAS